MIIKEIQLDDFKSHKDTNIRFHKGMTVITGENGAGKSSILEAIQYALFKKTAKDTVRHSADGMCVQLTFIERGNTYRITRRKTKSKTSSLLEQLIGEEYETIASSNKEVDDMVESLLNTDMDLFLNAIYIRQGEITGLTNKSPSERKKMISRLLKIDDLERSWEKMPQVLNRFVNRESELKGVLSSRKDTEDELALKTKELKALKDEYVASLKEREEYESELGLLSDSRKSLYEQKSKYALVSNDIKNAMDVLQKLRSDESALVEEYDEILKKTKDIHILQDKLDKIDVDDLNDEINGLNSEIKYCKYQNNSLKKSLNELGEVDGKCPICQSQITEDKRQKLIDEYTTQIQANTDTINENQEKVNELDKVIKDFERDRTVLVGLESSIQSKDKLSRQITSLKDEIHTKELEISRLKESLGQIHYDEGEYQRLTQLEDGLNAKLQKAIGETGVMKGKISRIEPRIGELKDKLEALDDVEDEIKHIKEYIGFLQDFRTLYSKNGLQQDMRATVRPLIEKNTRMFFEKFNFDYSDLRLDDDYEVSVDSIDGETKIGMLSGGEQIAVALALRLGITETIAQGDIECIILDEPTVHLDSVRVGELSNLLGNLNIVPQVVVVTHEEMLENVADTLLKVRKCDGVSQAVEEL